VPECSAEPLGRIDGVDLRTMCLREAHEGENHFDVAHQYDLNTPRFVPAYLGYDDFTGRGDVPLGTSARSSADYQL
jgi:hypothetical protein